MTAMLNSPFSDPDPNAMPVLVLARAAMARDVALLAERDAEIARKDAAIYALTSWLLQRFGPDTPEGREAVVARQALGGRDDG